MKFLNNFIVEIQKCPVKKGRMPGKLIQALIILTLLVQSAFGQNVPDSSAAASDNASIFNVQDSTRANGNINLSLTDSAGIGPVKAKGSMGINMQDSLGNGEGPAFNIRSILNLISFNFSLGYGRTFFSNKLDAFGAVRDPSGQEGLYLFSSNDYNPAAGGPQSIVGASNWLTNPHFRTITINPEDTTRLILGDSMLLKYRGNSATIPINLTIFYSFLDRFRAGAGITVEFMRLPVMNPVKGGDIIGKYVPDTRSAILLRYFGLVGGRLFERYGWIYYAEVEIGKINMLTAFNNSYISKGLYFNLGFPMEYKFSEYLSAVVKPSFEYKSYNLSLGPIGTVNHQYPAVYISFGFKYNIPEAPRCPLHASSPPGYTYPKSFTNKTCRIREKHYHNGKLYRGQPFYLPQNPDVGEGYKKFFFKNIIDPDKRKLSGGH
jgi:hypothetical protein